MFVSLFWKFLQGIFLLISVSLITFLLLSRAGGDALSATRENPQVSAETIERLSREYGLDRPILARYGTWATGALAGDLGDSFSFRVPVTGLVIGRFANTALMALLALGLALGVSGFLAILSSRVQSPYLSVTIEGLIFVTASTPRMVIALAALAISLKASIPLAVSGGTSSAQLWIGAVVLAVPLISVFLAQLDLGLVEAMASDFIKLARAKGLDEWTVLCRHAMRAAINPFLTVAGLSLGGLLGGSVIVESVLGWPGIGVLLVGAVRSRDVPLVMGIVILTTAAVWVGNFAAELVQMANDSRLRGGGPK